jgi:hypothetical protein
MDITAAGLPQEYCVVDGLLAGASQAFPPVIFASNG